VVFSLLSPGARSVWLAFFFHEGSSGARPASFAHREAMDGDHLMVRELVRLEQVSPGRWHCELPLPPGRHEYLFLVDGTWVMDPEASEVCHDRDGGFNCTRLVQAPAAAVRAATLAPAAVPRPRPALPRAV
jgi:hypothetical protein